MEAGAGRGGGGGVTSGKRREETRGLCLVGARRGGFCKLWANSESEKGFCSAVSTCTEQWFW